MELYLEEFDCGPCPYLQGKEWRIEQFAAASLEPGIYEELLALGFRRSGMSFYRNICRDCDLCVPIRLDVSSYSPSKSLRRLDRLNADISLSLKDADLSMDRFELYRRYTEARHAEEGKPPATVRSYASFLISSPLGSTRITEYRDPDGRLVATGYVDVLPEGLSSVYFAFDPSEAKRSIGTWSVARELRLAAELGKKWYYLGFWVPGSRKMDYKARFSPFEYARGGKWIMTSDREAAMAALGVA